MHNNRVCNVHGVRVYPGVRNPEVDLIVIEVTRVQMDLFSGSADVGDLRSGYGGVHELVHELHWSGVFDQLQCFSSEDGKLRSGLKRSVEIWGGESAVERRVTAEAVLLASIYSNTVQCWCSIDR